MINIYDLYDLYAVFTRIRFCPDHPLNEKILGNIISVLDNRDSGEINQIRKAVNAAGKLQDDDTFSFAENENIYTYIPFYFKPEDTYIPAVLLCACEELKKAVVDGNREKVYDLADCLHNLPIYIAESKGSIPKMFWKNEVAFYRKKWNKRFLTEIQKQF